MGFCSLRVKIKCFKGKNKPCSFLITFQMINMSIREGEKCSYKLAAVSAHRDEAKLHRQPLNGAWNWKKKHPF